MKEYIKSLFPWRWIYLMLFIAATSTIIMAGFAAPVGPDGIKYFQYPWLWYIGNILFYILIDIFLGLGREGNLFRSPKQCK